MSIHTILVIGATFLVAHAAVPLKHTVIDAQDSSSVVIDSNGDLAKSAPALVRRQEPLNRAEALIKVAEMEDKMAEDQDLYVLIGDNLCSGGGLWKRYELNAITPGEYSFCSASCNSKEECVGFDVGTTGCNLYTQKAVAIGTWPNVQFNVVEAFAGQGDHDAFPKSPSDLTLGDSQHGRDELYKCYRKTYYNPSDSYYWLIGNGTCSGGGAWKRYKMTPGTYETCEHACNLRDECIGFDQGTWEVQESVLQVDKGSFTSTLQTTTGCFMYTQKPVYGNWPGVEFSSPLDGEGSRQEKHPTTPNELMAGSESSMAAYNVNNETRCFGKTHWVNLEQYYMELGQQTCEGGGEWKHYKMDTADVKHCKDKCDEKDECVGLDHDDGKCRLYTNAALSSGSWTGVTFDGSDAFAGSGDHDKYAPTPFSLSPSTEAADSSKSCLAKTHFTES